jgi:hypothetical protein
MIRSARRTARESRWLKVLGTLNEYQARLFVADKALDQGRGGISRLSELTGMSRTTITKAVAELNSRKKLAVAEQGQIREAGGGRKKVEDADPVLPVQLGKILEETSAGDPMSALQWTNKSTEAMAEELTRQGHPVSDKTVARCLRKMGYSMQLNQKTPGRPATPEPGPAVPLHQPAGSLLPEERRSGAVGGHEEERIGGTL